METNNQTEESTEHNVETVDTVKEVKEETGNAETNVPEDKHIYPKEPFSKDNEELNTDPTDILTMPNNVYSKLMEVLESINSLTKEQTEKLYNIDDKKTLTMDVDSVRTTNVDDMLYVEDNETYENNVKYGSNEYNIRDLNFKPKNKKVSGDAITALLSAKTGIGGVVQVPLWHSGFWLTLKPIKDSDIINLEIELANSEIELGRDTSSLIYSNYSVVYNRIVTNFILQHTQNTSLDIPISELRNYIKIQDLYPLVNGILYSMNPKGYEYARACVNGAVLEDNKPKCTYILNGVIDFKKLLYVDRSRLTKDMFLQMSKRSPKSVTPEEVIEYQRLLTKDNILKITTGNGLEVEFILDLPTLEDYIVSGELWINNIINDTQKLFTESTDEEVKNNLIKEMTLTTVLGMYNSFVDKITFDEYEVSSFNDINLALETLSADDDTIVAFINGIKDFINKNTIAVVGLTNFDCPVCKESQATHDMINFKEIIPLNVVESFFDLCTLRIQKLGM